MAKQPLHNVVIAGAFNTKQARQLPGYDSLTITVEAVHGALADAGITLADVDGVMVSPGASSPRELGYMLGMDAFWYTMPNVGVSAVLDAAAAIACGLAHTVIVASGEAGVYTERESTAPWTRPTNEFVECWGLYTAAEFALQARRHMHEYGTRPEHLARVASVIRNNGYINPEAAYYQRGPWTPADILDSRMVTDPFHLLDCSMTGEGGTCIVLTTAERARDMRQPPVYILGGAAECYGPAYKHPPVFEHSGFVGRKAAATAFGQAGLGPADVQTCEFYDAFSWECIRQYEAFGFCEPGEGKDLVMTDAIEPGGRWPLCTDGGVLSHSHTGSSQMIQKVVQSVRQVRGQSPVNQVADCHVSLCATQGAGALATCLLIVGDERP
jgi:acetyl-CoA acetyltransferase